ncbi:hypothetical protein V6N13_021258 [Hibiscus sabdariffa]|uniref:Uncharacterized protein n=2 Tax=Hibiscus sabdariffa TaxID=183260 RepID=A0ABR1ZGS8_9ROSI
MGSSEATKPYVVCVPFPAQGHVNPMMQLAKLIHSRGFHVTFVNTEFNHRRLVRSRGAQAMKGLPDFRFETIPDGLPPSDRDATQDVVPLCESTRKNCLAPFLELLAKLNSSDVPPVDCIVSDGVMSFGIEAGRLLGIPQVQFWTASACGFMCYLQYNELFERGIVPFKDENFINDGTLDILIDWIPEHEVLDAIVAKFPRIYTVGPLNLVDRHVPKNQFNSFSSSLWKEDTSCIEWLNQKELESVIYVNYGSITTMSDHHFKEFAWGLANSKNPFLWIVRPDVVMGESAALPEEFFEEIKDRGFIASWCPQDLLLSHRSVVAFLTHCGWNSTLESISRGMPVICWPFFAEQQTNCRFACTTWGIGMEVNLDVNRNDVEAVVKEMMEGKNGKKMKEKALDWKKKAEDAIDVGGSSYNNFERFINEVLSSSGTRV